MLTTSNVFDILPEQTIKQKENHMQADGKLITIVAIQEGAELEDYFYDLNTQTVDDVVDAIIKILSRPVFQYRDKDNYECFSFAASVFVYYNGIKLISIEFNGKVEGIKYLTTECQIVPNYYFTFYNYKNDPLKTDIVQQLRTKYDSYTNQKIVEANETYEEHIRLNAILAEKKEREMYVRLRSKFEQNP